MCHALRNRTNYQEALAHFPVRRGVNGRCVVETKLLVKGGGTLFGKAFPEPTRIARYAY